MLIWLCGSEYFDIMRYIFKISVVPNFIVVRHWNSECRIGISKNPNLFLYPIEISIFPR